MVFCGVFCSFSAVLYEPLVVVRAFERCFCWLHKQPQLGGPNFPSKSCSRSKHKRTTRDRWPPPETNRTCQRKKQQTQCNSHPFDMGRKEECKGVASCQRIELRDFWKEQQIVILRLHWQAFAEDFFHPNQPGG